MNKPKTEKPKTEKPKTEKPKTEKPKTEKPKPKRGLPKEIVERCKALLRSTGSKRPEGYEGLIRSAIATFGYLPSYTLKTSGDVYAGLDIGLFGTVGAETVFIDHRLSVISKFSEAIACSWGLRVTRDETGCFRVVAEVWPE